MTNRELAIILYHMASDHDFNDIPESCHAENISEMENELANIWQCEALHYCLERIAGSHDFWLANQIYK